MTARSSKAVVFILTAAALPYVALALLIPQKFLLDVPLAYEGDGLSHAMLVKSVLEVGWFPVLNPRMGAPFGAAWFDYANADAANLLLIKIAGVFSRDWLVAENLFYLLTFAATAVAAFLVMRKLGLRSAYALVGALLFAELPYHFLRPAHLLLTAYWSVPIGVYLAINCAPRVHEDTGIGNDIPGMLPRAAMAVAVACGGIYYAFFTLVLVTAAGALNALARRRWRAAVPALAVSTIILVTIGIECIPTLGYWYANGTNQQVAARSPAEAEYFALKPIQLILPQSEHRVLPAKQLADNYAHSSPLVNENASASLGFVGAVGLLLILSYGFWRVAAGVAFNPTLDCLAALSIVAITFGMIGGAGSMLATAGFASIRAYNRISVFLGFIGIATALLFLQYGLLRACDARMYGLTAAIAGIAIAVLGTLDQLPSASHKVSNEFENDRSFFAVLERQLEPGTLIYQLPYHPFPEAGPVNAMDDYSLARGYLHTDTLRWSYGSIKGRTEDAWLRALADHNVGEQLDLAAKSGFGAVYVDRRGYPDHGEAVEAVLRRTLGDPIVTREDGQLAAYLMRPTGTAPLPLAAVLPKWETPIQFDREILSPRIVGVTGFSDAESTGRWTDAATARLEFRTPLPRRFRFRIDTLSAMPPSVDVDLPIEIDHVLRTVRITNLPTVLEASFELPSEDCRVIEIRIPKPISPRDVGIGFDTRTLGIHVRSIAILPTER